MNMMESGLRWLVQKRIETSSVPAIYESEAESFEIRAVPCKSARQNAPNDPFDLTVEGNALDFIVPYEDLPIDPLPGDKIVVRGKVYEVNNYTTDRVMGAVAWRWCEGCYEVARRIHTKGI